MKRFVIAVTRTCGSRATTISKLLAKELNIDVYDKDLLKLASQDSGINYDLFAQADEHTKKSLLYRISQKVYHGELIPKESGDFISDTNLFNFQAKVLKELAEKESYICIGRAADYILRDNPNVIKVFIHAPLEQCISKEMQRLGITRQEAQKHIRTTDKYRRDYYKYHTGKEWENPYNYDLCLNTGVLSDEACVACLKEYLRLRGYLE